MLILTTGLAPHPRRTAGSVRLNPLLMPSQRPASGQDSRELDRLTVLYGVADRIQRARHVDQMYDEAVEGLRQALGADRSALLIADRGGIMRFKAWSGLSAAYRAAVEGHSPWSPGERDPRPVVIADAGMSEALGEHRETVLAEGIRALAFIPLLHRGRLLGKFMLYHDRPHDYGRDELRLAEVIAGHLAFAIWRSRSDADQAELLQRFEAERSVLESVVKQMPAGVLLADVPTGRIVMSNPQVSATWRRSFPHAQHLSEYAGWGGRAPDGSRLEPEEWPLARSVLRGETVRGEEIIIERGDGTRGVIRMSSGPVTDSQGRQLAAVATLYDVTEEREAESDRAVLEEATRVLNASLELESTLDALSRVVIAELGDWCAVYRTKETGETRLHAATHRLPSGQEAVRRLAEVARECALPEAVDWVVAQLKPLLVPDVADGGLPMIFPRDAPAAVVDALRPTTAILVPLVARDRPLGAVLLARNGQTYGERELKLASELGVRASLAVDNSLLYEKARAADQAKANFLAVMSHEFRTPLSAILGYADILTAEVHGALNPKQLGHLDRVKASVRHLSHLVDEILTFASMEAGRERVRRERLDLVGLASDVAGLMEPIAVASGLELRVRLPDERLEVDTDGSKVRQILINLLSNAVKYTPSGHVDLLVEARGERIQCTIEDTGPGIPPEHVEDVFEPFWQVDRGDGRRITGTGLGLAVARRLARLMGGEVELRSEVGRGSAFTLTLPRCLPDPLAATPEA